MNAYLRVALLVYTAVGCSPRYAQQGPTVSSIPEPPPPPVRTEGPLSLKAKVPETPWRVRQELLTRARSLYLDHTALREDGRRFLWLVDELFPTPSTPEMATGVQVARRGMGAIEQLAPYPLDSVFNSFASSTERLPLCPRPPGEMWHCWMDLVVAPPASGPPFELTEPAPGVARLVIHDLANASDPAWSGFPAALDRIARARGIVIDLRKASGTDPRPLLPLLERLTGRAPFRPLRAIRRHANLDPYVADYAHRFIADSRDRDVWAGLVGAMPPSNGASPAPSIAVIVGGGCGAACELAARALVAYAGATLFGDVQRAGRLERDDPARLVLPRSKIEIYFNATEYLLDETIERETGPTTEWWLRLDEMYQGDLAAFALHEIEQRLAGRQQPRCDSLRGYSRPQQLPPALRAKLPDADMLGFTCGKQITLTTAVPLSALRRFAATCSPPITISGSYAVIFLPSHLNLRELSRLAQSDLVERIDIDCEPVDELNWRAHP